MKYENIMNAINSNVWHILPEKMDVLLAYMTARITNGNLPEVEAKAPTKFRNVGGDIAVMNLSGTISQRMGIMDAASGGTSTEAFGQKFDELANDPKIKAIVMNVDSPGGSAYGLEELSTKIREARNSKRPIIAIANSLMASAAYYIGSAADEVIASPGAQVGSIGTIMVHTDISKANEEDGIVKTIIRAPANKAEGNPFEPLSDSASQHLQATVDQYYAMFVDAVAANRGISSAKVRTDYGQGRLLTAKDALSAGMVDRISTYDSVIARLRGSSEPKFNRKVRAQQRMNISKSRTACASVRHGHRIN